MDDSELSSPDALLRWDTPRIREYMAQQRQERLRVARILQESADAEAKLSRQLSIAVAALV